MAKGCISAVQDNGLNHIKNNCTRIAAVIAYVPGTTTYAQAVDAANVVAKIDVIASELVLSNGASNSRVLTTPSKVDVNTGAGNPTHFLYLDVVNSTVLVWDDETGAVVGTLGGALVIPALTFTLPQPA